MSRRAWVWAIVLGGLAIIVTALAALGTGGRNALAVAIAFAEGYGTPGAIPTVRNNPGDLELGSDTSPTTFSTAAAGWAALYAQIGLIITGTSGVYSLDMTIAEMAQSWTGGDNAAGWASNVAYSLRSQGIQADESTTLRTVLL